MTDERDRPWPVLGFAAAVWLGTRIGFILLTHLNDGWLGAPQVPGCAHCAAPLGIFASWGRWDAGLWQLVAFTGYSQPWLTPFYPGYPAVIRVIAIVLGSGDRQSAGMIATSVCALAAFLAVAWLVASEFGPAAARGSVLMLAAYPLSMFMYAPYSEALSVALVALALLAARRRWWWAAALATFAAALTRPTGALVAVAIAWEIGRAYWPSGVRPSFRWRQAAGQAAALLAAPAALLGFMGFLWIKLGDPLIGVRSERIYWGRQAVSPLKEAQQIWHYLPTIWHASQVGTVFGIDLAALLLFALVPLVTARRMPVSFTLYSLAIVALTFVLAAPGGVPGGVDPLLSEGRFLLVGVPVFAALGRLLERRPALAAVLPAGFLVQGVLALLFINWRWVG